MRRWLRRAGIARERLLVDPIARDTIDNAELCAAIIAGLGAARVSLVTERYHARRSARWLSMALRRRGLTVAVQVCPTPDRFNRASRPWVTVRESFKIAFDRLRIVWRWA